MNTCTVPITGPGLASRSDDAALLDRIRGAARAGAPNAGEQLPSIDGFRIERLVAEGGMGRVFEAQQLHPSRRTAIKLLLAGRDTDERRRRLFRREADALARLRHADIAAVFCAGHTADGAPFLAMEYVDGVPLDAYAARHALPVDGVLRLFARICRAVHHAHERGVVHRDLKPSNILVDDAGNPKVLDFGLARVVAIDGAASPDASVTLDGRVAGTLAYMSPEQLSGKRGGVDARSDVYALGVILYELLTGSHPTGVQDRSLAEIIDAARASVPAAPSRRRAGLRVELDRVVLRSLQKHPGARYQTARDLAEDIDRCRGGVAPAAASGRRRRRGAAVALLIVFAGSCMPTNHADRGQGTVAEALTVAAAASAPSTADMPVHRLAPTVTLYGDLRTIEQNLRTRLELVRRMPGSAAPDRATAVRLALVLERLGRHAEAEPLFREALEDERAAPYRRAVSLVRVARCVAAQGAYAESDALFAECRRLTSRLGAKRDAVRAEIQVAMARDLLQRGLANEARELLDRAGDHLDDDAINVQWARWSIASANAEYFARMGDASMESHWRGAAADVYGSPATAMVCER